MLVRCSKQKQHIITIKFIEIIQNILENRLSSFYDIIRVPVLNKGLREYNNVLEILLYIAGRQA